MRNRYLILLLMTGLLQSNLIFSQSSPPDANSATVVDPFNMSANKLGSLSNSVNLFTGDVTLPFNLVSFPGREGAGINVSISYSSANIETLASTWNIDAPTGVLGLGWSLPTSKIVVDNNQTSPREDDTYYLMEGGSSTRLVCVANSSGVKTFKTKSYSNKIITFTELSNRWDVTLENGTKQIYGSDPSAVEWIGYKGNWIGNGSYAGNYQQGAAWNLFRATNIWGDQVNYAYNKTENLIGLTGVAQTEASYLSSITDSYGHTVQLVYNNKLAEEVMEPHTEAPEPDGFQEKYERKYLDRILVKVDGTQYYEIDFRYSFYSAGSVAHGNNTKRMLASMVKVGLGSTQGPVTKFSYLTSGAMTGALSAITLPTGGTITYDYSAGLNLTNALPYLNVYAPSGYEEPQTYIYEDYVVVVWRQMNGSSHDVGGRPIKLFAYYWNGKWREADLSSTVSSYSITKAAADMPYKNFQVVTGKDFFATMALDNSSTNYSYIDIYKKDEGTSDTWTHSSFHPQFLSASDPNLRQIFAGNNFVEATDNYGNVMAYQWNGSNWYLSLNNQETPGTHFTVAANNYIFSMTSGSPGTIRFYYQNEQNIWTGPVNATTGSFNTTSPMTLYASNTHVVAVRNNASAMIVSWDQNYGPNTFSTYDTQTDYGFNSAPYVSENTVGLGPSTTNNYVKAFAFNGSTYDWRPSNPSGPYGTYGSFGENVILGGGSGYSGSYYNPNTDTWSSISTVSVSGTHYAASVGNGYALFNGNLAYQFPSGWDAQAAPTNFLASERAVQALPRQAITSAEMFFLKNGSFLSPEWYPAYPFVYWYVRWGYNVGAPWVKMIGQKSMVLGPGDYFVDQLYFYNAAKLQVRRIDPKNFNNDTPVDYPVVKITQSDGISSFYTSFDYDVSAALTDPDRTTGFYGKVTTINGSGVTTSKPFGSTESLFFTGATQAEVGGSGFPTLYKLFTGQVYQTKAYNSSGGTVSQRNISFASPSVLIQNSASAGMETTYQPQVSGTTTVTDGITVTNSKTYNSNGSLSSETELTYGGSYTESIATSYTYASTVYSTVAAKNMLGTMFMVKKSLNGQDVEGSVTRYNESYSCATGGTIPVRYDQYSWHGSSSLSAPPSSIGTAPDANWLLEGIVSVRDAYNGAELETRSRGGQINAQILNESRRAALASVSNAPVTSIAYTSFEDPTNFGNFSLSGGTVTAGTSITGSKYYSLGSGGISRSGLDGSRSYTVSFWATASSGSVNITGISGAQSLGTTSGWTLFQYKVPVGNSAITVNLNGGSVNIDEIRIVPSNALATTSTVHPLFGATSSSDANNHVSVTLYDNLGRPVDVLDEKGNIIKNTIYNTVK